MCDLAPRRSSGRFCYRPKPRGATIWRKGTNNGGSLDWGEARRLRALERHGIVRVERESAPEGVLSAWLVSALQAGDADFGIRLRLPRIELESFLHQCFDIVEAFQLQVDEAQIETHRHLPRVRVQGPLEKACGVLITLLAGQNFTERVEREHIGRV